MSLFMLDLIRNSPWLRATNVVLLFGAICVLSSCAANQEAPLVSDNASGRESSLPWNQQEKWENQGQLGPMAERVQTR